MQNMCWYLSGCLSYVVVAFTNLCVHVAAFGKQRNCILCKQEVNLSFCVSLLIHKLYSLDILPSKQSVKPNDHHALWPNLKRSASNPAGESDESWMEVETSARSWLKPHHG